MTTVLGIDTAGPVVGAAVVGPGLERSWSQRVIRGADAVLIPAIAEMLEGAGPVDLVAVSIGPGAFTGLRVGVATALGFAVSKQVPVVCVSSLEVRAMLAPENAQVLALLDARKGRVYGQVFDTRGAEPLPLSEPEDRALPSVVPQAPFVAVGEGVCVDEAGIQQAGGSVSPDFDRSPAVAVARLGQLRRGQAVAPNDVALAYLRDADAKKPTLKK